jgi:hypothetical protein
VGPGDEGEGDEKGEEEGDGREGNDDGGTRTGPVGGGGRKGTSIAPGRSSCRLISWEPVVSTASVGIEARPTSIATMIT